jgi:predicted PurR-regulated permease PerM
MERIEISYKTIVFTVLFLIFLWILFLIKDIILIVFVAFVAMAALNPLVKRLEKYKIPRPLSILLIYILGFLIFGGLIAMMAPILVQQTSMLLKNLPGFLEEINFFNLQINLNDYSDQLAKIPGNIYKILAFTFSNLLRFFTFLVITFYLLIERKNLDQHLHSMFLRDGEEKVGKFIRRVENRIGGWVRGQLVLMFIVGLLSYIGLTLLDLDFALPLAVLAGLLEIVPNIGPTVSMIPAIVVGLAVSPIMGLTVVALYFLIQQLENNLIVPKVMQKSLGLNPLITIIVLMIGLKLGGALGMILSMPIYLVLEVIAKWIYKSRMSSKK